MVLRIGQTLHGAKCSYRLIEPLLKGVSKSTVFKALMLPGPRTQVPAQWALVKTTSPDRLQFLKREYDSYIKPTIASSPFIRAMYDVVGDPEKLNSPADDHLPCLIFEWMDCTLDEVSSKAHRRNSPLLQAISKAVLSALATLKEENLVHTDLKPDNILLSDIHGPSPIVKTGDLATPEGFREYPLQPFAMRAPEVWRGIGCFHSSDVWYFAVTLFDWISPGVFDRRDIKDDHWPEPWCIAKLLRLFRNSVPPPIDNVEFRRWFRIANLLDVEKDPDNPTEMYMKTLPLEKELERMDMSAEFSGFFAIYLLLTIRKGLRLQMHLCRENIDLLVNRRTCRISGR